MRRHEVRVVRDQEVRDVSMETYTGCEWGGVEASESGVPEDGHRSVLARRVMVDVYVYKRLSESPAVPFLEKKGSGRVFCPAPTL